jgi:rubrerythrin
VKNGATTVFFGTRFSGQRVLSGYYDVLWYAPTVSAKVNDFCLAAERVHFVANPLTFSEVDRLCGTDISNRFRLFKRLSPLECTKICSLLEKQEDATPKYVAEIDRLERFNLLHTGFRYPTWRRENKFSWEGAVEYLTSEDETTNPANIKNSSSTDHWQCAKCEGVTYSKALLRKCPLCGALATLRPKD